MNLSVISMAMKLGIQDGNVVYGNAVNAINLSIRNILKDKVIKPNESVDFFSVYGNVTKQNIKQL